MPFAAGVGCVTGGFQHFRKGDAAVTQSTEITRQFASSDKPADARLVRVEAGEQARARRAAAAGIVAAGETQAIRGEGVECRRADLATVAAEVRVAEIVGEDEENVGALVRLSGD